jgi:hypothetical protein
MDGAGCFIMDYSIEKPKGNPLETPARKIMLFRNPDSQGFFAGGCPERPRLVTSLYVEQQDLVVACKNN